MIRFGQRVPAQDRALVMAIVNRTPDSFYDRGAAFSDDAALARVEAALAEGADIIDIGGVKAGPGAEVDVAEEIRRVIPFVAEVRSRHPDAVISVDTWRGEVGRLAVAEGADLLNDTWAGVDPTLGEVAAATGVAQASRAASTSVVTTSRVIASGRTKPVPTSPRTQSSSPV